jgi:small subunit ribosomal protein S16
MAVRIRLKRIGAHKSPFYRLVVSDSRSPRDGRFIEEIGTYNPLTQPAAVSIDEEKALKWLQDGAQASDTVRSLFSKAGIMTKFHELKLQK